MKALRLLWSVLRHPDLPYVLGWHRFGRPAAGNSTTRAILVVIESAR